MSLSQSNFIEMFSEEAGIAPSDFDGRTNTSIYKKLDLRKLLNISYSGSFFDFVENDAAIDELIAKFAALVRSFELKGGRVFTRKPIGSGFNVELRVAAMAPVNDFLQGQRIKSSTVEDIGGLEHWGRFSVLSLSGSALVGHCHKSPDDRSGFARYCLERFPALDDHFNDALPNRIDPIPLIAQELNKSQTFYLKW